MGNKPSKVIDVPWASNSEKANKLQFASNACKQGWESERSNKTLPEATTEAALWACGKSDEEIISFRQQVVARICKQAHNYISTQAMSEVQRECDPRIYKVIRDINIPLMKALMLETGHVDKECINLLLKGANSYGFLNIHYTHISLMLPGGSIVGELPTSGTCEATEQEPTSEVLERELERLQDNLGKQNWKTLSELRPDRFEDILLQEIVEEARLGRVEEPKEVNEINLHQTLITKRFGIEQGIRKDGTMKIRAIDDASASGLNGCCKPTEKLFCNNLDDLTETARLRHKQGETKLSFWKADIKAAFRRIPISAGQRHLMASAFKTKEKTIIVEHNAMPFGTIGSVHGWHRIGQLLWHIMTTLLKLPHGRYVDDFFGVERESLVEHTTKCVQTMIDTLMGTGTAAPDKLLWGNPLTILGIDVRYHKGCIRACVEEEKAHKWCREISEAVKTKKMSKKEAERNAGRLAFATQWTFRRMGRAMIRPFYQQAMRPLPGGAASKRLISASRWWIRALGERITQEIKLWREPNTIDIFTDAASDPPTLAAVIFTGGKVKYTVWETDSQFR